MCPAPRLGFHLSAAQGLDAAVHQARRLGCGALQLFVKSPRSWRMPSLTASQQQAFGQAWRQYPQLQIVAHAGYLINLASPKDMVWQRSITSLLEELARCAQLGIPQLVVHPGSRLRQSTEQGHERIRHALGRIWQYGPQQVQLLLENTAGQGSQCGFDVADLALLAQDAPAGRVAFCLDTCHAWAAGYALDTAVGYEAFCQQIATHLGLTTVLVWHLNDAAVACGSRKDRHARVGTGYLGWQGCRRWLTDQRWRGVPTIMETAPLGETRDRQLIEALVK